MVYREKHRMEAFVRFQRTEDDLYYAGIEPDFDVIPLLSEHFEKRYADQRWLIYDLKRRYGIYYDLTTVEEVTLNLQNDPITALNVKSIFHDSETMYQDLWKNYFKHVNIASRRNIKLHVQHVPKRYWKHLTEKA
jgi:probable DNA metabolism protein